jgi:hypothetical protein
MEHIRLIDLFNSAIDVLCDCFGEQWLIDWGIDNAMTDEEIANWLIDDKEKIAERRQALREEK